MILNAIGIEAGKRHWKAFHVKRGASGLRAERAFTLDGSIEERAAGLKEYAESKRLLGLRVSVALTTGSYVSRTIELPPAEKDSVRGVLAFELEKHLPSDPSGWAYTCEILESRPEGQLVLFSAAPSETVEMTIKALESAGLNLPFVTTAERAVVKALSHSGISPPDGAALLAIKEDGVQIIAWARPGRPCYSRSFKAAGPDAYERELRFASTAMEGKLIRCLIVCEAGEDMPQAREAARRMGLEVTEYNEAPAVSVSFGAALLLFDGKARSADLAPKGNGALKVRGAALTAAGGALGLALLLPAFFLVNEALTLRKLNRALAELGPERGRAQALTAALSAIEADIRVFREVRGEGDPGFLEILKRLTEATPSDTYLTGMEYDRKTIAVEGASGKASGLFMALERSGLGSELEFEGPVTAGPDGKERFRIRFKINNPTGAEANARR
ncbi:MAG: PilN domain-containing protein [Deltaproteobacteria bacterium]|nr:PilN domain-containing protein [Deltaproteobacteria bacterium]MBZ0219833.1 PilN domain-containing protein [Deltaproteobacteria bacterium]